MTSCNNKLNFYATWNEKKQSLINFYGTSSWPEVPAKPSGGGGPLDGGGVRCLELKPF